MGISTGAAILGSSAIGALSGGKNKQSTQSTAPILPENVKKAYDTLIDRSVNLSAQPYQDVVRTRAEPSGMYGGLFDNPELMAIQNASDREYFANMNAPKQMEQPAQKATNQERNPYGLLLKQQMEAPDIMNGIFTPQPTGLDEQAYNELGNLYAQGKFSPTTDRYGRLNYSNNPFMAKLLQDSMKRNADLQNASMRS